MKFKTTKTLREIKEIFIADTNARKNYRCANMPIIELIDLVGKPNAEITCEMNPKTLTLNRGSVVECLIKMLALKLDLAVKSFNDSEADLVVNGIEYEIKYSTGKGYANYNANKKIGNLIFVDSYGIYLTNGNEIVLDKCGKHIATLTWKNYKTLYTFKY